MLACAPKVAVCAHVRTYASAYSLPRGTMPHARTSRLCACSAARATHTCPICSCVRAKGGSVCVHVRTYASTYLEAPCRMHVQVAFAHVALQEQLIHVQYVHACVPKVAVCVHVRTYASAYLEAPCKSACTYKSPLRM